MRDDRDRRPPGGLAENLLELIAGIVVVIGCGGTALLFIGLLYRAVIWAWS